jgi:hypothetical protein
MEIARVFDTALRKAGAVWVSVPGHPARLVWTVWRERALWLITAPGEQEVPGLADGAACTVVLRSPSTHSRLLDVDAVAHAVPPGAPERDAALAALAAARLNAPGGAARRWAQGTLYRLDVTGG